MDRGGKWAIVHGVTKSQHRTEVTHTHTELNVRCLTLRNMLFNSPLIYHD